MCAGGGGGFDWLAGAVGAAAGGLGGEGDGGLSTGGGGVRCFGAVATG